MPSSIKLPPMTLRQGDAVDRILDFLASPTQRSFLLAGYAGTGKTFCLQHLVKQAKGRMIFTAPTNKATKVLRETLSNDEYKPQCKTIHSLLGLRLEPNGEIKELTVPEDPVDLTSYSLVIVDEASMVNAQLLSFIISTMGQFPALKFLFLGDPAQLPPVKELRSPVWDWVGGKVELTEVMRNSGPILDFSAVIRGKVNHPAASVSFVSNNDGELGVWACSDREFREAFLCQPSLDMLAAPGRAKLIAWRNVTVDSFNRLVRSRLFHSHAEKPWLVGDRVVLTEPAKDLDGKFIAVTDDEGCVTRVDEQFHPVWKEFKVWRVSVTTDENTPITLFVLHAASDRDYKLRVDQLAREAKAAPRKWATFWDFKDSFHQLRHAYAITAHRSQGSTYETAFVNWRDILLNRNRQEAMRCLYVAASRPKKELYLG